MPIDMAAAVPAAPVAPSPNTAKRRLPSSGVPYGSASRRRREESLKEEKEREGERGLADVELMKWLNSSEWRAEWRRDIDGGSCA